MAPTSNTFRFTANISLDDQRGNALALPIAAISTEMLMNFGKSTIENTKQHRLMDRISRVLEYTRLSSLAAIVSKLAEASKKCCANYDSSQSRRDDRQFRSGLHIEILIKASKKLVFIFCPKFDYWRKFCFEMYVIRYRTMRRYIITWLRLSLSGRNYYRGNYE